MESHRLLLFLPSSPFVWLCSSLRSTEAATGREREGERRKRAAAPLISAKLSGCLPLALCYASTASLCCLELQLPGARRYHWGGSAYDVLIIRFAITSGRKADLLLLSKLRKRKINTYNLDVLSYQWRIMVIFFFLLIFFDFGVHCQITAVFISLILLFRSL